MEHLPGGVLAKELDRPWTQPIRHVEGPVPDVLDVQIRAQHVVVAVLVEADPESRSRTGAGT